MIKAKLNNGDLVFGLSDENMKRLKNGEPIKFNLKDMGLDDQTIFIFCGESEDKIFEDLLPYIDLNKTKIHL